MRISGITYATRKTHRIRNTFLFLLIVLLTASVSLLSLLLFYVWRYTHPPKLSVPLFPSQVTPSEVSFTDITGKISLNGWYFKSDKDSQKAVIIIPGHRMTRLPFGDQTLFLIKQLMEKGYNVLTFDPRNTGRSQGHVSTFGMSEKDDVLGAVKYLRQKGADGIVLLGFSDGASAGIMAAAESQWVDAVIADSPYADLEEYIENRVSAIARHPYISMPISKTAKFFYTAITGVEPEGKGPKQVLSSLSPRPVIFIHSKNDSLIAFENSLSLYSLYRQMAGEKVSGWWTQSPGQAGSFKVDPYTYTAAVLRFLDTVFPPED